MKIFLSYASEDKGAAEQIFLTLVKDKHRVFFDHTDLPAGSDFDSRIRNAIKESKLFIFLISPDSVAKTSYALTELKLAREKWWSPVGHVLPVMLRATSYDSIPNYLKAVTVLEPEGSVAAEVAARVANWRPRYWMYLTKAGTKWAAGLLVIVLFLVAYGLLALWRRFPDQNGATNGNLSVVTVISPQPTVIPMPTVTPTPASMVGTPTVVTPISTPLPQPTKQSDSQSSESLRRAMADADIDAIVGEILSKAGLKQNFTVTESNDVDSTVAVVRDGKRLLLYNPVFLSKLRITAKTDWALVCVLAHEIGHHLLGHTISLHSPIDNQKTELEADEFSGLMLARMGATLSEAQAAVMTLPDAENSNSHPPRSHRLEAVRIGWQKGSR